MSATTYALSARTDLLLGSDPRVLRFFEEVATLFPVSRIVLRVRPQIEEDGYLIAWRADSGSFDQVRSAADSPPGATLPLADDVDVDQVGSIRIELHSRDDAAWDDQAQRDFAVMRPLLARILQDIADLRRLENESRMLLTVCDASETAVLLFSDCNEILWVNNHADELLRRQTEEKLAVSLTRDHAVTFLQFLLEVLPTPDSDETGNRTGTPSLLLTDGTRFDLDILTLDEEGGVRHLVILRRRTPFRIDVARPGLESQGLSNREIDVVEMLMLGLRNAEIAERLDLSEYTIKDHLKHVFHKIGIRSRGELVSYVLRLAG